MEGRTTRRVAAPVLAGVLAVAGLTVARDRLGPQTGDQDRAATATGDHPGAATGAATGDHPGTATAESPGLATAAKARNVIFINGDGMSAAQREAARLYAGLDGRLAMDSLPYSGQLTTTPRDPRTLVTDSAAGASAWATGQRTYNGAISVDVNRKPLPTLGTRAKAAGKATGLVTTAQVTDASPAAFFANAPDRAAQDDIARQYLEVSRPDVILGGGEDWWLPAGRPGAHPDRPADDESSRGTHGDLIAQARQAGYRYVTDTAQLAGAKPGKLLGLFANEAMTGNGLAAMTRTALTTLSTDPDGFFLFVEEEGIDEAAHQNDGRAMLQAMGELDKAVAVARDFAQAHRGTLMVVTGDHETGGLTIESGTRFPIHGSPLRFTLDWATTGHTGVDVPITAYGPGAERFTGKHPNTYVHDVLAPDLTR
ncbi:alkaline phosphatase [Actinoplanes sp. TBRC 11911]|uniref:alkaline phosphatase n=1 Tax=Actinoplanes sp. TBRC 11911 TaxID=2729386 RepID=UPI00145D4828|nr:alkaline phosphatase [Actinoplanes sp. TBRC 11911]NMO52834.1 alkaline phosphatase [Actinoplanes sp. TBRC 11911]